MIKKQRNIFLFVCSSIAFFVIGFAITYGANDIKLTEHEQQAVEAVSYYKSILKDPCSLRIYGDMHLLSSNTSGDGLILLYADAKNSYGGYSGKEPIEITCIYAGEGIEKDTFLVRDKDTEGYHNISSKLDGYAKYLDGTLPLTYYKIDGAKVAKAMETEYIEWER